jgi:hypothetical protein
MRVTERRIAPRVQTELPASFVVRSDLGGEYKWLVGRTANASKSGMLLEVAGQVDVPPGAEGQVRISAYLASAHGHPVRYLTARAVIRREISSRDQMGPTLLALEFRERLRLRSSQEGTIKDEGLHKLGFIG